MATVTDAIMDGLERAKEDLKRDYEARVAALEGAMQALEGSPSLGEDPDRAPKNLSVSEKKVDIIHSFLLRNGPTRQADIGDGCSGPDFLGTPMNTGSVSVALRVLQERGKVHKLGRKNGSRVWEAVAISNGVTTPNSNQDHPESEWTQPEWAKR